MKRPGHRLRPIIIKEFRQIRRDPRSLIFLLVIPAFLLLLYGYALNFDVKHLPLAVCDLDGTSASREFIGTFEHTEYFNLKLRLDSPRAIDRSLGREDVRIALVIPRGFGEDLAAGREPEAQVIVDGSNAQSASTALGYIGAIVQEESVRLFAQRLDDRGLRGPAFPLRTDVRVWYNPELRSIKFLVPGLMAFILMVIVVVSTSFSVVREKEQGTMEQIAVSPVRPSELIIGKTIPYILISLVSAHLVLFLSFILFGISIKGNYLFLLLTMVLFLTGGLGQGVLISTVTKTQQVAFMISILTTFLPTFILSGFIFPIRNMPWVIQAFSYLVPAKYFLSALRGILIKGSGLSAFGPDLLFLAAFAVLALALSIANVRKTDEERPRARRWRPR